jgi:ABC-type Fe3+/spermidine/putrescine transport system ATPase subunit
MSLTIPTARPLGSPVTIALRPEAISVEPTNATDGEAMPNSANAVVEQIVYHGCVSHLYLRVKSGDPLIAFQQNHAGAPVPVTTGMNVRARWPETSNHIVRE